MDNANNIKAKEIIRKNLYMTIAVSSKDGDPWIANIYFACDDKYNFYWYSSVNTLHSALLKENPIVAISVFNSTAVGDDVDAVYIKANVQEVSSKLGLVKGLSVYGKKMLKTGFAESKIQVQRFIKQYKDFQGISKLRLYKATPIKVWKLAPSEMFNEKFIDSRIEVNLNE